MGMVVTATAAVCLWVILWSIDVKGFDAFMLVLLILLIGATVRSIVPKLPGRQTPEGD
jgi:hypothetical protein